MSQYHEEKEPKEKMVKEKSSDFYECPECHVQFSHLEVKKTPREQLAEKLWEHVEQNPYYRSDSFVVDKNTIIRLAAIAEDFFRKSFKESIDSERAIADRYLDALKKYGRCQSTCDSFWMKPCSCGFTKAVGESNG